MPLTSRGITVSIVSGGGELVPHNVETDHVRHAIAAYVASTAGQDFAVVLHNDCATQVIGARIQVDGYSIGRRVLHPRMKYVIDKAYISDTCYAPMQFADYKLVDSDDPRAAAHNTEHLGVINVKLYVLWRETGAEFEASKRRTPLGTELRSIPDFSRVVETRKKAGGHRVQVDVNRARSRAATTTPSPYTFPDVNNVPPFCSFKFFYQPKVLGEYVWNMKEFAIHIQKNLEKDLIVAVNLDGWLARYKHQTCEDLCINSAHISDEPLAPTCFSDCALVDPDDATASNTQHLGTIVINIWEAGLLPIPPKSTARKLSSAEYKRDNFSRVTETSKKAGGHRVVLKSEAATKQVQYGADLRLPDRRSAASMRTFKIFYQPKEILIARGITPRSATPQASDEVFARGRKRGRPTSRSATTPASSSQLPNKRHHAKVGSFSLSWF
ncbi:hypothetical protein K488DRAFT_86315 [Vararia minispora EC-137]|uniref:Uncharacterized protein n=1 Tax=Vararia minispora EC-137 TaxID=1314806 RepID=A0ACB8QJH2_9AGAM|nr:hypothetical protein K488DRAFT_86315 [Vararia minispora EC-137]